MNGCFDRILIQDLGDFIKNCLFLVFFFSKVGLFSIDVSDTERYDTTITVPTNLKDGVYILQFASLVGNIQQPYYSCAKLTVTGGNPSLKCTSNKPPTIYKCFRSGGPPMNKITVSD